MNIPDSVRPALREQVFQAVKRLGYVANAGARAMSLKRSGTVGVVVPTVDNAIFARGLQVFQQHMARAGQVVLLASSDYDAAQEQTQALALLARGVDALALTGISQHAELLERLKLRGLPCVHVFSFPAPKGTACVGFRNREAIAQAVRYLLDLGHRNIAMLAGVGADNDRAAERIAGVRQALAGAGLKLAPGALVEVPYNLQAAREGTRKLLDQRVSPTALVCGNDVLAWGAMLECQARGVLVPRDLSIVGFDDLEMSHHLTPALTTMHVPTERMWQLAAQYLLDRLDGSVSTPLQQELGVELIVRGSTGPPARRGKALAGANVKP
jgi:LacI family transcriptional regulator